MRAKHAHYLGTLKDSPGVLLGALGNRLHLRCRNCGMTFSVAAPDDDDWMGMSADDKFEDFEDDRKGAAHLHELHDDDEY